MSNGSFPLSTDLRLPYPEGSLRKQPARELGSGHCGPRYRQVDLRTRAALIDLWSTQAEMDNNFDSVGDVMQMTGGSMPDEIRAAYEAPWSSTASRWRSTARRLECSESTRKSPGAALA